MNSVLINKSSLFPTKYIDLFLWSFLKERKIMLIY
jgi:hypothetical protein